MESSKFEHMLISLTVGLFALIVFGLLWAFFLAPAAQEGFGWFLFSYAMGLTMIVLPCTLPLAFVIVPLAMSRGRGKGFGMALAFGLGVAITLSLYGVLAALVGKATIGALGAPLETVKNWVYFVAGLAAYLFALGELGLIKVRMPSYTGAAPGFIQKQQDYLKALFLGLFLGNIGVGCPHPATPLILIEIARSSDVFYGFSLFFVHAIGRILPLLLLAFLGILGVNALSWLVARKEKVEKATGWAMVFVAGFILVLGLFTHAWWVNSGQHTFFEEITQEERFIGIIAGRLGVSPPHGHTLVEATGLFGLPLELGNWVLVILWIVPMCWYYLKAKRSGEPRHLWFLVVFSLLLIETFVYYLPTRFLYQMSRGEHGEMMGAAKMMEGMHGEAHGALYHEESEVRKGLAVNLNVTPVPVITGAATRLDFFVNEKPGNIPVTDLEIEHTKLMHVIGVRNDMEEFFHIHPVETQAGLFSVDHTFAKPGIYKVWSEIKKDGMIHTFSHPELNVVGEGAGEQKRVSFGRNAIIGNYQVSLNLDEPVAKGHEHDLSFDIHTLTGEEVAVEPYLGADMHLTIIKDDLKQFIHTHPIGSSEENHHEGLTPSVMAHGVEGIASGEPVKFQVIFPEAGLYKAFAQFRPAGIDLPRDEALTAGFWIEVKEERSLKASKGVLAGVSLILIILLSWGVKKFLERV